MTAAEQARAELRIMERGIESMLAGFRDKTTMRVDHVSISDVYNGEGKVIDQRVMVEARL